MRRVLSQRFHPITYLFFLFSLVFVQLLLFRPDALLSPTPSFAQVEGPDDTYLFKEDSEKEQDRLSKKRTEVLKDEKSKPGEIDFTAPTVKFDQSANEVSGEGGVLISGEGYRIQGERGKANLDTKQVTLDGDVLLTGPESTISADSTDFNLESEVGTFTNARFTLEDGAYSVRAKRAEKINAVDFDLEDCALSTCHCPDGEAPWQISGSDVHLEREGYAHAYNALFEFKGVPLFYSPWLAFPVKQERSSGLLVPEFGYSSRDGVRLRLPTYLVLDDSSDMTITPFTESKTRHGLQLDYREAFSERSSFDGRVVYSNESPRDGEFRGTDITGIAEPEIDEHRFGGFIEQSWSNSPSADIPMSVVSDVHWVSDTLFLREMDDADIGLPSSRYATSRVAFRAGLSDYVSSSVVGEWNEALVSRQDTTLQRLPEFTVTASKSYRPFGFNPYGLKITPKLEVQAVNFRREEGFDGLRYDVNPSIKIPFHYKNYFNSELVLQLNQTFYELDEALDLSSGSLLDDSQERTLFRMNYEVGTILERVYDLPQKNFLTTLTSLGSRNQTHRLQRVKHTYEPKVAFSYVPGTSQSELPLFDSFDRIRKKSLVTYELVSRILGSFGYHQGAPADFEEFVDSPEQFTRLDTLSPLTDFDSRTGLGSDTFGTPTASTRREGRQIREIMAVRLVQSYDYVEDDEDLDPSRDAFSDLGVQVKFAPTRDFAFTGETNYDIEDTAVSSWNIGAHLYDDRGDRLRTRYTFVDNRISQLEGNLEIPLSSRLRLGYYARFDERESEFIEQQAALRVSSRCDCWHFDIGFSDEINPDRERVLFRFTLQGLGDLTQNFGFDDRREENT